VESGKRKAEEILTEANEIKKEKAGWRSASSLTSYCMLPGHWLVPLSAPNLTKLVEL